MKVSWFPQHLIEPGFLGLTHTPGAFQGTREEDLAFLAAEGVQRIVCLQQPFEFNYVAVGTESLQERASAVESLGMHFTHFPIQDMRTPELQPALELVQDMQSELEAGRRIVVHCFAGLGRAGTIAASVLAARGWPADRAVELVRSVRPGAIQTDEQQQFVSAFAAAHAGTKDA